ncbi:MAG: WecB/TagA/CpsF family glycosyltransferase [Pirellulales bacterium]|nr:WecB/TagA/CpsF family glycosyltransferase [Pirellulales bacterium]
MNTFDQAATTTFEPPTTLDASSLDAPSLDAPSLDAPSLDTPSPAVDPTISILGVEVTNTTERQAIDLIEAMIRHDDGRPRSLFFVNAHTLNLAAADRRYRDVLNTADHVFADGTGVRWAARLQGVRMQDNVNGTDLTPELFRSTAGRGYSYFLLGATEATIGRAARYASQTFTGWTLVGSHHGYLDHPELTTEVIRQINEARPDVLLVGMGNPLQERWIRRHRHRLDVPVCLAVGGLFTYWAGELRRSPRWLRRCGWEWLGILLQQPHKARRYLLGNPRFLIRALCDAWKARRRRRLYSNTRTTPADRWHTVSTHPAGF